MNIWQVGLLVWLVLAGGLLWACAHAAAYADRLMAVLTISQFQNGQTQET